MNDVELIKSKLDIADIIKEYVELKPAGASLKGLCPFHDEKTPSFMVHQAKQIFHCFGCQKGGDVFTFLQEIEHLEFPETLRILASKAGVQLKTYSPEKENSKTKIQDILSAASRYYEYVLTKNAGEAATKYLTQERGLTEETIKKFHIGFAPVGWDYLSRYLIGKKFDQKALMQSGMVITKDRGGFYDRFRGRIMFPLTNNHDQIVGFSGRLLPQDEGKEKMGGKYINSPETPVFNKSQILFGFAQAKDAIKQNKFVILAEGQMDVISSHQAGVSNIVASAGTAITTDQLRLLKRLTNTLVFALDQDQAGIEAMKRTAKLAWQYDFTTRVVVMPEGVKDPAELVVQNPEKWHTVANDHIPFIEYYLNMIFAAYDLETAAGKREAAREILPFIKSVTDPIERAHYIDTVSDRLKVDQSYIQEALEKIPLTAEQNKSDEKNIKTHTSNQSPIQQYNDFLLALVIKFPELQKELVVNAPVETFSDSQYETFYKELHNWYNQNNKVDTSAEELTHFFEPSANLATTYSLLELKAEQEFSTLSLAEAKIELEKVLSSHKTLLIKQEIKQLADKLKYLEANNADSEQITEVLRSIDALNKKLSHL